MASTTLLFVGGVTGLAVGLVLGRWWGRRSSENVLLADVGEAAEVRSEAAASVAARTERRLERIMALAQEQGTVRNDDVEELFCISDRTASAYLRRLTRLGQLRREGAGRGTYYVPATTEPSAAAVGTGGDAGAPRSRRRTRKTVRKATKKKPAAKPAP